MKKFLSTLLVFTMLISCFCISAAADETEAQKDYGLSRYIQFFCNTGVFAKSYNETAEITRADFAQILTNLINKNGSLDSYRGVTYDDVAVDYYASKEINFMGLTGIMKGKGNNKFYPDDKLTVSEAAAGIVRMLGYSTKADYTGGFGTGYVRTANDLGALNGVPNELIKDYASAGAVAKMLFNVLETQMISSYLYNGEKVENISNVTLLKDYLELEKGYGMVMGADGLYLNSAADDLEVNQVLIGNDIYDSDGLDFSDYLGVYIDFYYKDDDSLVRPNILAVISKNKSESLTVYSNDIKSADKNSITYKDNDKRKNVTVKIADDAFVLYNGRTVMEMKEEYIPKNGYAKLVKTEGKNYDFVIIFDFQSFVIQSNNKGKIAFKYGLKYTDSRNVLHSSIDLNNDDLSVIIKRNGKSVKADSLAADNVVSIASNGNRYYVEASDTAIKGVIKGSMSNPDRYLIFEKYYTVDPIYNNLWETVNDADKIELGLNTTFYIDFMGNIVGTSGGVNTYKYAYLYGISKKDAFGGVFQVKLLLERDFTFKVCDVAEKCILNGSREDSETVYNDLQSFIQTCDNKTAYDSDNNLTGFQPRMVKVKLSGDEVTAITTKTYTVVKENPGSSSEVDRSMPISDNYILVSAPFSKKVYQGTYKYFTSHSSDVGYIFVKDVYGFTVPVSNEEKDFDSDYISTLLPNTDNKARTVVAYDINFETGTPGFVNYIIEQASSKVELKNTLYGVKEVSQGDECAYLTVYSGADGETKLETSTDAEVVRTALALKKGDVIQCELDSKGKVGTIAKRMSYIKPDGWTKLPFTTSGTTNGETHPYEQLGNGINLLLSKFIKSTSSKAGDFVVMNYKNPKTGLNQILKDRGDLMIYDGEDFYTGSCADLAEGDLIFAVPYCWDLTRAVAYKYSDGTTGGYTDDDEFFEER